MMMPEEGYPYPMPMTLGHEPAGVVEELGEGATGVDVGQSVIVYGCWGCGVCEMCADGSENLCLNGMISPGLGTHGAMAEHMVVDTPRHLVPIDDLDPVGAASLTDAALHTPKATDLVSISCSMRVFNASVSIGPTSPEQEAYLSRQ